MKKIVFLVLTSLLLVGFNSCQKHKYCQCYAYVDGEDIPLGEDVNISEMTAAALDSLDSSYNVYIIESGTCNDKAKEIVGWGQVTCREVSPKYDSSWLTELFSKKNNNTNTNKP